MTHDTDHGTGNTSLYSIQFLIEKINCNLPMTPYFLEGYPQTPDSSEGLIPRATICYMGIDPYVLFF